MRMEHRLETLETIRSSKTTSLCPAKSMQIWGGRQHVEQCNIKRKSWKAEEAPSATVTPTVAPCHHQKGVSPSAGEENRAWPAVFSMGTYVCRCSFPALCFPKKRSRRRAQRTGVGCLQIEERGTASFRDFWKEKRSFCSLFPCAPGFK